MFSIFSKMRGAKRPRCAALVAAAGSSSRMGGVNKLLEPLDGVPVLARTLMALQKAQDVDEIVVATREEDLFAAMEKYHPGGTDYIIDATGIEECIQNSLKLCKKGGYVALAGYGRGKTMSIRIDDIHINNLHVVGAGNNWNQHKKAIAMMADGAVDMTPFVSETLDLSQVELGLEHARTRPEGFVKALFTFKE